MTQIRFHVRAPEAIARAIADSWEAAFEADGFPCSAFEVDEATGVWEAALYIPSDMAQSVREIARERLKTLDHESGLLEETVEDTGWLERTLSELKPVKAGRFLVHGSHDADGAKANQIPILIDAGMAFGTGHHGTTAGCLEMIETVLKRSHPRNALDLGTGTGVLAIAIALAAHIPVLASDIDPVATQITCENAKLNGASADVTAVTAAGFGNRAFAEFGPFDLITANILAGPLQALAPDIARNLAPGGKVILSGLLPHQRPRILSAFRLQGLVFERVLYLDGWMTLLLKRPS